MTLLNKRLLVPLLAVLLALSPLGARAQISNYNNLSFKISNLTRNDNHIVRTVDSSHYVTLAINNNGDYVFSYCTATNPYATQLILPHEYTIEDFVVVDQFVVFCGYGPSDIGKPMGVLGYFKLPINIAEVARQITILEDQNDIQIFKRLTAYLFNPDEDYIQAAMLGLQADGKYSMATVKIPLSTTGYVDYVDWPLHYLTGDVRVEGYDITNTKSFVAVVGKRYDGLSQEYNFTIFKYAKSDVATLTASSSRDQYYMGLPFPYNQINICAVPGTDDILIAYPWKNTSPDESFMFFHTCNLVTMTNTCNHYRQFDAEMNISMRGITYLPTINRAVTIYDSPMMNESRLLIYDPYDYQTQNTYQYYASGTRFNSIDCVNGRYAVTYTGDFLLYKDIKQPYFLIDNGCDNVESIALTRQSSISYVDLPSARCRPLRMRKKEIKCGIIKVEQILLCEDYHPED